MAFLKTILIILLVYFALRFTWKLAKPSLMRYIAKKMGERFQQSFGGNPFQEAPAQNEGDVTIDRKPPNAKTSNQKVGEYVDYEEVD